jgi:transcriptional regulator with XRE-family HTH domain
MNLATPVREPVVLDVLGASGGVAMPDPDLTGFKELSLEDRVNGLTFSTRPGRVVYVLEDTAAPTTRGWYGVGAACLGLDDENSSREPAFVGWKHAPIRQEVTATGCSYFIDAPTVLALAADRHGWMKFVRDQPVRIGTVTVVEPAEAVETVESAALVETVQYIRDATKLSVNDLSAMLGVKRRALYNWLAGTAMPPSDRIRRLFALRDAVAQLADAANGDARRVRVALLAPISGDTVSAAFTDGDAERIELAVDAAVTAMAEGRRFTRRVPASARTRSAAGTADELRFERDSLGLRGDSENDDES